MSANSSVEWLKQLRTRLPDLPFEAKPKPYWSSRKRAIEPVDTSLVTLVRRVRLAITQLEREHFFARLLGFECCDGHGESHTTAAEQLDLRVGKGKLITQDDDEWDLDDLCDYIEVFHDLASRPTRGWYHDYGGCGFHPARFHAPSGQALYRWKINSVLADSGSNLALADSGEDVGRMTHAVAAEVAEPVNAIIESAEQRHDRAVLHAVALFRNRNASVEGKKSAIVTLAGELEAERALLKEELFSKDVGALFTIMNSFNLRHKNVSQQTDYPEDFLDWIFLWYLATIDLIQRLQARGRETS